jgi:hypothetical protein
MAVKRTVILPSDNGQRFYFTSLPFGGAGWSRVR